MLKLKQKQVDEKQVDFERKFQYDVKKFISLNVIFLHFNSFEENLLNETKNHFIGR